MSDSTNNNKVSRRNILKGFLTVPVVGAVAYGAWKKERYKNYLKKNIFESTNMSFSIPDAPLPTPSGAKKIRLGIVGYGIRGKHLLKAAGFVHPKIIDDLKLANLQNPQDHRYEDFINQENLNVEIRGVCDLFDVYANMAVEASANKDRKGVDGPFGEPAKRYRTYQELVSANDIDAVIIATPDHYHAKIAIAAANNGKHVYVEKPMTQTVAETYLIREAVKKNNIIFQLGHQGRQTESYIKAKEAIDKNVLGKISLIEVCTNRNDPNGAWQYKIHPEANPQTIDWNQFTGDGPQREFSLERFFRWRCWWDYGSGLTGDLLTHEYDAINQIMAVGIPESCMCSGGIYFYKDGRDVPDVQQAVYEYPERDLTFMYSATLSSQRNRGKVIMGHDANMELGSNLTIYPDGRSTAYKKQLENKIMTPSTPIYSYRPGLKSIDAVSSATEKYFAGRGLLYTYRGGKRLDTTHLHIKEWLDCIRKGIQPSCNIDQGFEEAIVAHMATISYRENRKVYWDPKNEVIIGHEHAKEGYKTPDDTKVETEVFDDVTL